MLNKLGMLILIFTIVFNRLRVEVTKLMLLVMAFVFLRDLRPSTISEKMTVVGKSRS